MATEDEAAVAAAHPELAEATARYRQEVARVTSGRSMRAGRSNPESLYADTGPDWREHLYLGTLKTPELAAQAIDAHNAVLDLRWLLWKGLRASVASYLHIDHGGSDILFEVVVYDEEGEHLLTVDEQPSLGAALAEARKQAEAAQ